MTPVAIFGIVLSAGAPNLKESKPAVPSLVGVWNVDSCVNVGKCVNIPRTTYEFTADGRILVMKDGKPFGKAKYTVDLARQPAEISITEDGVKGARRGIWKVEKGVLSLCWMNVGEPGCPTAFEAPEDSRCSLYTFTPVK